MNLAISEINLGLTGALALGFVWLAFRVYRLDAVRKHFYSAGLKKNLETIVTEQNAGITKLNAIVADLNEQTENIRTRNQFNFQKIGFVKFSQFGEAGNLSFTLVLLNDRHDGVAISSLHARDGVRVYAKEITQGKSRAKLTEEETNALNQAIGGSSKH